MDFTNLETQLEDVNVGLIHVKKLLETIIDICHDALDSSIRLLYPDDSLRHPGLDEAGSVDKVLGCSRLRQAHDCKLPRRERGTHRIFMCAIDLAS